MVRVVLDRYGDTVALEPVAITGLRGAPGLPDWAGVRYGEAMSHTLRIWPHDQDSGGFFVAKLVKRA